jgi:hypothetical protein
MIRQVLHFLLVRPERLPDARGKVWVKKQEAALGRMLEKAEDQTCRVILTPRRVPELLNYFQTYRKEGGRINCFGIAEELVDDDQTPVEWFILRANYSGTFMTVLADLQQSVEDLAQYPSVKADRMKPGVHVAGGWQEPYVSERFKNFLEKRRLQGLEFLWCRDVGKYQAPQWYLPICHKPLGRGLDDPRVDTKKFDGVGYQTLDPRGRHGQYGASEQQYRRDAGPKDPQLKKLLALMRSMELEPQTRHETSVAATLQGVEIHRRIPLCPEDVQAAARGSGLKVDSYFSNLPLPGSWKTGPICFFVLTRTDLSEGGECLPSR